MNFYRGNFCYKNNNNNNYEIIIIVIISVYENDDHNDNIKMIYGHTFSVALSHCASLLQPP